jgi:TPR repeat protein
VPLPAVVRSTAATVAGPTRTPMSRTTESHMPVDELYARARELEAQLQVIAAIGLYREASQRGHAPSSQRLMELYADGAPGVARDYRVAVFFKERAVQQGASFDPVWRR